MKLVQCDFCKEVREADGAQRYSYVKSLDGGKVLLVLEPVGDMCQNCVEAVCQAVREALATRRAKKAEV